MKRILVMGALGQIGTELVETLRIQYGQENVVASDIRPSPSESFHPFEVHDATDVKKTAEIVKKYSIDTLVFLPSLLSATAEIYPQKAFELNLISLFHNLEVAREHSLKVFYPSTIGVFSDETPKVNTPQHTVMRPQTMYGVTKLSGELLCDYYHSKYGVDIRGIRFPGIISHKTLPGGGTTDYAVEIYYKAISQQSYTSYIAKDTKMDMVYMPDAVDAIIQLLNADPEKLRVRNAYNITGMSFDPEEIAASIRKHIPEFALSYDVDPVRQSIADSWPDNMDDSYARADWGWNPKFKLPEMTEAMLTALKNK